MAAAWSIDEDAIVIACYPGGGVDACQPLLNNRSVSAIQARAHVLKVHIKTRTTPPVKTQKAPPPPPSPSPCELDELIRQLHLADEKIAEATAERSRVVRRISIIRQQFAAAGRNRWTA
jgi:hypothetical protein